MDAVTASTTSRSARRRWFRIGVIAASLTAVAVGSVILATRASNEKTTTSGITATLHLPGHPHWLAVTKDGLWLSLKAHPNDAFGDPSTYRLIRVDRGTGAVDRTVRLPGPALYLATAGRQLLASVQLVSDHACMARPYCPSELLTINPTSGRILARRRVAHSPYYLAVDRGVVWGLEVQKGLLHRIDPRTLTETGAPLDVASGHTFGFAVGAGYLWATSAESGDLIRIDPQQRKIAHIHVGNLPVGIVVAGGSVWVALRNDGEVVRVAPSLHSVHTIAVGPLPTYMTATGGTVFVANAEEGTVDRIDDATAAKEGPAVRIAPAVNNAPAAFALAPDGDAVWVTSSTSDTVSRLTGSPEGTSSSKVATQPVPLTAQVLAASELPSDVRAQPVQTFRSAKAMLHGLDPLFLPKVLTKRFVADGFQRGAVEELDGTGELKNMAGGYSAVAQLSSPAAAAGVVAYMHGRSLMWCLHVCDLSWKDISVPGIPKAKGSMRFRTVRTSNGPAFTAYFVFFSVGRTAYAETVAGPPGRISEASFVQGATSLYKRVQDASR